MNKFILAKRRCKKTMNKAILIGRLTRDPEIRYTQTGKAVATFTLAIVTAAIFDPYFNQIYKEVPFGVCDGKKNGIGISVI